MKSVHYFGLLIWKLVPPSVNNQITDQVKNSGGQIFLLFERKELSLFSVAHSNAWRRKKYYVQIKHGQDSFLLISMKWGIPFSMTTPCQLLFPIYEMTTEYLPLHNNCFFHHQEGISFLIIKPLETSWLQNKMSKDQY